MSIKVPGSPIPILLVEDNPDHAELIKRNLKKHKMLNEVQEVDDGEKALQYLEGTGLYSDRQQYPFPELILLDLRLPKIDGLTVLEKVKTNPKWKAVPVVVLTSSRSDEDVARAYKHHANSYLNKPIDFEDFKKMIADLGFYWLGWNQSHPKTLS